MPMIASAITPESQTPIVAAMDDEPARRPESSGRASRRPHMR
jgi:hypothetical protein